MAHKPVNRIAKSLRTPSAPQIDRTRRIINSLWAPEERQRRQPRPSVDHDLRFEAHVRFLRFLVEQV